MHRVLVVGITGAGKTTAAKHLASKLGAPFHEMDALAIGPNWSTPADLQETMSTLLAKPRWVIDSYGYEQVRAAMWSAADTVVWLDYPLRLILFRVIRRSLARSWYRTRVFGGNVETWRSWLTRDHPAWWALTHYRDRRSQIFELTQQSRGHLMTIRLTSPAEFRQFLDGHVAPL